MRFALSVCEKYNKFLSEPQEVITINEEMKREELSLTNQIDTEKLIGYLVTTNSGSNERKSNLQQAISIAQSVQSNLISAFLYLNCLDQIGDLFCEPNGKNKKNNDNAIKKALLEFGPELSQKQLSGLVNLRHALAHKMGLVNVNGKSYYKFIVTYDESSSDTIIPAPQKWDGKYKQQVDEVFSDKFDTKTSYVVNVHALGNLVQYVLNNIEKQKESRIFYVEWQAQDNNDSWNKRYQKRLREIAYRFFVYNKLNNK